jgi:hypothetical protein
MVCAQDLGSDGGDPSLDFVLTCRISSPVSEWHEKTYTLAWRIARAAVKTRRAFAIHTAIVLLRATRLTSDLQLQAICLSGKAC